MPVEPAARAHASPSSSRPERLGVVAVLDGEQSRPDEGGRPGLGRLRGRPLERGEQQLAALLEMAAHEPEGPERGDQPKGCRRIALEQMLERRAEVFALGREPLERGGLAGAASSSRSEDSASAR